MKKLFSLLLIFAAFISYGQAPVKKPVRIIVINNEIVSMEKVEEYMKAGDIKLMRNGVSPEEKKQLVEKLGEQANTENSLISIITLYTEAEKKQNAARPKTTAPELVKADEYVLKINDTAQNFTVNMTDGTMLTLADLKGKVVLLNFWATWCGPCLLELYDVPDKINRPFKGKDFIFLTIATGEAKEKIAAKMADLKTKGLDFVSGIDTDQSIWHQYGRNSIPKSFLIDQNGIIRYVSTGYTEVQMDVTVTEIKKLLDK